MRAYFYMLRILCRIDCQIHGAENVPKDRPVIIMSKHQSTWETFFLPLVFHDPAIIIKKELLWVPFFGWGLATIDPISINRRKKSSAMQQIIEKGKQCLQEGRSILVFPEGTRTAYGSVGHYRLGGARLAVATGHPVLPVAHDAGRYWPRKQFIKRPGTIHLVIGPPIESKGRTAEEVLALTKNWIEDAVKRIDSFVNKPTSQ